MSCGGGGLRMSLCPDTGVNTEQELLLNRLASAHICIQRQGYSWRKRPFYTHIYGGNRHFILITDILVLH